MNEDYIELTKLVGNLLDAPGMGGNISVKCNGYMKVKASGQDMKIANHSTSKVLNDKTYEGPKPSMEYLMHLAIDSKYVVHYHPVYVLPHLCSDYKFQFGATLDYVNPGVELADAVSKVYKTEKIIFLRNHGVIIHGDTLTAVKQQYHLIRLNFLESNFMPYTPDDVVDSNNVELYLFRKYIELFSIVNKLKLNTLSDETVAHLNNDMNEKYRMNTRMETV